jgi:hypothetical protein
MTLGKRAALTEDLVVALTGARDTHEINPPTMMKNQPMALYLPKPRTKRLAQKTSDSTVSKCLSPLRDERDRKYLAVKAVGWWG